MVTSTRETERKIMQACLPNNDILEMKIETEVFNNNVTWFTLALSVNSEWHTIAGTQHLDMNKMFSDVGDLIKDLEAGKKEIDIEKNRMPCIRRVEKPRKQICQ